MSNGSVTNHISSMRIFTTDCVELRRTGELDRLAIPPQLTRRLGEFRCGWSYSFFRLESLPAKGWAQKLAIGFYLFASTRRFSAAASWHSGHYPKQRGKQTRQRSGFQPPVAP